MGNFIEFKEFQKIPRLTRECIVTEKIDGTNGVIAIENGIMYAGSRSRWLWSSEQTEIHNDNHGFARWAMTNKEELMKLGKGYHYGEWWGSGIQRGYGLINGEKRFSLFNVSRWLDDLVRPACCHVVPVLHQAIFDTNSINACVDELRINGSHAMPGFMKPEGIVVFHVQGRLLFKKTIEKDEEPKGLSKIAGSLGDQAVS